MSTNTEEYKKATQGWNNLIEQSIKGLVDLIRTETKNGFLEALDQHSTKSNQNEKADENLLTRTQAANFLNVSLPTIGRLQKNQRLIYYKVGRQIFFKKTDLLRATMVLHKKSGVNIIK